MSSDLAKRALDLGLTLAALPLALPLMVACVTADLVAQWSGGRPIYTQLLERALTALRRPSALRPQHASTKMDAGLTPSG